MGRAICGDEYRKAYYLKNRDRILEKNSAYAKVHREVGRKANRKYRQNNLELCRLSEVCRMHSISIDDYNALRFEQELCCAICGIHESQEVNGHLCIDHNHKCCPTERSCGKCIRGLLCKKCNQALGLFNDNPDSLRKAAVYVL